MISWKPLRWGGATVAAAGGAGRVKKKWDNKPLAVRHTNCAAFCLLNEGQLRRKTLPEWEEASAEPYYNIQYIHCTLLLQVCDSCGGEWKRCAAHIVTVIVTIATLVLRCDGHGLPAGSSLLPSTVPILLVRTESVWSSQPPPHRPSLKRLRMDWLESSTTRIHRAAVTVLEWRCSSMNIKSQSKPSVRTSSSHALKIKEEREITKWATVNATFKV